MDTSQERRKVNKLLNRIKYNAYKLKESGSLPLFYFQWLCNLSANDSIEKVRCYIALAYELQRVNGYYFKFPETQKDLELNAKKFLEERGIN